jgi:hypothetical protein
MRGVAISSYGEEMGGMGVSIGDYDLDGHLDILKTHFQLQSTGLYRNDGKANFEDQATAAGIADVREFVSWGAGIVDLDNDGYPDIFWVTGSLYPDLEKVSAKFPYKVPRILYRNRGDGTFLRVGDEAGPAINSRHISRGCAFGDFDNDGDLDILIMNQHEPPSLLRNDAPKEHHWLKVRLEGTRSNRSALGARVTVRANGKVYVKELLSQDSYVSSNDPRLHFGLGAATTADIEVRWPLGSIEKFPAQTANRLVTILEGKGIVPGRPFSPINPR